MKVKELKEVLNKLDENLTIGDTDDFDMINNIVSVKKYKPIKGKSIVKISFEK